MFTVSRLHFAKMKLSRMSTKKNINLAFPAISIAKKTLSDLKRNLIHDLEFIKTRWMPRRARSLSVRVLNHLDLASSSSKRRRRRNLTILCRICCFKLRRNHAHDIYHSLRFSFSRHITIRHSLRDVSWFKLLNLFLRSWFNELISTYQFVDNSSASFSR